MDNRSKRLDIRKHQLVIFQGLGVARFDGMLEVALPRLYFDPENLRDLAGVFNQARATLKSRGQDTPWEIDQLAKRILLLASAGVAAPDILADAIRSSHSASKKRHVASTKPSLTTPAEMRMVKCTSRRRGKVRQELFL